MFSLHALTTSRAACDDSRTGRGGSIDKPAPGRNPCADLIHPLDPYPRNRKPIVAGYVGKKVTLSTTDFHYLVGQLVAFDEAADRLHLTVRGRDVYVARASVATLREAHPALIEYLK
jgi:hypothetical protein